MVYNNNKFKISWNGEYDLPDGSYSVSNVQDYFEFIIKKHETLTQNLPYKFIQIKSKLNCFRSKNRLQTRIVVSRNNETIREYKKDVDKDKGGEDVPKLESAEVFLMHCNLGNNSYQEASKVLFTFVPNKQFGQLITISPHSLTITNTKIY